MWKEPLFNFQRAIISFPLNVTGKATFSCNTKLISVEQHTAHSRNFNALFLDPHFGLAYVNTSVVREASLKFKQLLGDCGRSRAGFQWCGRTCYMPVHLRSQPGLIFKSSEILEMGDQGCSQGFMFWLLRDQSFITSPGGGDFSENLANKSLTPLLILHSPPGKCVEFTLWNAISYVSTICRDFKTTVVLTPKGPIVYYIPGGAVIFQKTWRTKALPPC